MSIEPQNAGKWSGSILRGAFGALGGVDPASRAAAAADASRGPDHNASTTDAAKALSTVFSLTSASGASRMADLTTLALMGGAVGAVNLGSAVGTITERKKKEEEKQKEKDRRFQNLLDQINQRIAAIADQIKVLDDQIEAVDALIKLEEIGEINPTNPKHQRYLIAAGIEPDKWGTITIEELRQRRLELEREREAAKTEERRLKTMRDSVYEASVNPDRNGKIDLDKPEMSEINDKYRKAHHDYDPKNATPGQAEDIRKLSRQDQILQRPAVIENEGAWFRERVARLEGFKATPEYTQTLDKLIDGLSESTRDDLIQDEAIDTNVRDRLAIHRFDAKYAQMHSIAGTPEYEENLEMLVEMLDDSTKQLMLSRHDLPEDVRKIIYLENPEGLQAQLAAPTKS